MSWAILKTQPRAEYTTKFRVCDLGFEVYVPEHQILITHARRASFENRPLFPTYIMIRLEPSIDCWSDINRLPGAINIIKFGLSPSLLKDEVVDAIREAQSDGVFDECIAKPFLVGDTVRIKSGPFSGMIARIAEMQGSHRNLALLNLLDQGGKIGTVNILSSVDKLCRIT
jgi:transcription antitermination factor NusG